MMEKFKNRSLGDYLKLGCGVASLLIGIVWLIIYFTTVKGNISFTDMNIYDVLFFVAAGIIEAASFFFDFGLDIVGSILIGVGIGSHLYMSTFPWADLGTGVPFFVNDAALATQIASLYTIFLVLDVLLLIVSLVACFIGGPKKKKAA